MAVQKLQVQKWDIGDMDPFVGFTNSSQVVLAKSIKNTKWVRMWVTLWGLQCKYKDYLYRILIFYTGKTFIWNFLHEAQDNIKSLTA
jgi:hypothetical protein